MKIVRTVAEVRNVVREHRVVILSNGKDLLLQPAGKAGPSLRSGRQVALVPTMGAFHAGHVSLMDRARAECGFVVVSLFVNPAQFNEPNDLERYPRNEASDAELAATAGVDVLFAPLVSEVYPAGFATTVEVADLAAPLEGIVRGSKHFRGVATVVTKLLNMVQPDIAYFGEKDAQQALIVRRIVRDLDISTEIVVAPTIREPDGLAMSSRNVFLGAESRVRAAALSRALNAVAEAVAHGERNASRALAAGFSILSQSGIDPEYFSIVSADTLVPAKQLGGKILIAIAARFGSIRLIDNVILDV